MEAVCLARQSFRKDKPRSSTLTSYCNSPDQYVEATSICKRYSKYLEKNFYKVIELLLLIRFNLIKHKP